MDIVTETIIRIASELHGLELTEEDVHSEKTFDEWDIDSIDQIEMMLGLEEAFEGMELPDFDNAEIENLKTLWQYLTDYLPDQYKS